MPDTHNFGSLGLFKYLAVLVALFFGTASLAGATPSLLVEDGVLTGANNVTVDGRYYDVRFIDGTCEAAYGQCAEATFSFDYDRAVSASWVLLESVFIDSSAGAFNSEPYRIRGCVHQPLNFGYPCMVYTAAYFERPGVVTSAVAINQPSPSQYTDWVISGQTTNDFDFAPYVQNTWAVWQPSPTQVPEPATWGLALGGFGGLAALRSRRRAAAKSQPAEAASSQCEA